jgi:hypothetical protein
LRLWALCRGLLNDHGCAISCGWPKVRGISCRSK